MVEYHPSSDTTEEIVEYPAAIGDTTDEIVCCNYKEDFIFVLDWFKRYGFVFDTKTREFSNILSFQQEITEISIGISCVAIGDYIHIFHAFVEGRENSDYTICSLIDKTSQTFKGPHLTPLLLQCEGGSDVIKIDECYQSSNKMLISGFIRNRSQSHFPTDIGHLISNFAIFEVFKFGGYNEKEAKLVDSFYIGTLKDGDPTEPLQWTLAPQYTLKDEMALWGFGYIRHSSFILTFGGVIEHNVGGVNSDNIYILDLRKNCGWIYSCDFCVFSRIVFTLNFDQHCENKDARVEHLVGS